MKKKKIKKESLKEEYEYYNKSNSPKKHFKISQKSLLFLLVFIVAIFAILFSPIFAVKEITMNDIKKYTKEEICQMTGISIGDNIFSIVTRKAEKTLETDNYVSSAKIKKIFPNKLNIAIDERRVRGYVPYMSSYLYIDEYGRVLETSSDIKEPLPIVTGLNFTSFRLGETINCENPQAFDVVVTIAQVMTKYEMLDAVVQIDVEEPDKIMAYVRKIEINLGDGTNCDEKIRTMSEVIKQIPESDRGSLDLSDMSKPIIFKYLT